MTLKKWYFLIGVFFTGTCMHLFCIKTMEEFSELSDSLPRKRYYLPQSTFILAFKGCLGNRTCPSFLNWRSQFKIKNSMICKPESHPLSSSSVLNSQPSLYSLQTPWFNNDFIFFFIVNYLFIWGLNSYPRHAQLCRYSFFIIKI